MALLACAIALVRDTMGHDWYAAGKLTFTEILIEAGFDDRAPTEYRTDDGVIVTLTRDDLKYNGEALLARDHLLRTAADGAELGAWCGFGGALLCLALIRRPKIKHPVRRPEFEAEAILQAQARERLAPLAARPEFVALPHAATVPVRAPQSWTPPLMLSPVQTMISVRAGRISRTSFSEATARFALRRPFPGVSSPGIRRISPSAIAR